MCNTGMDNPLKRAIEQVGGLTKAAGALGVSPQRLGNWIDRGVPAEHCPSIERITDGAVRCEELRPDVDWAAIRGTAAQRVA